MDTHFLVGVAIVHFFALVSPGPDVLLVIRTSMLYSKRQGIFATLGIATGAVIWALLTILGLITFLKFYPNFDIALHLFGIGYLSYLVYEILQNVFKGELQKDINFDKSIPKKGMYITGLITNLSNPKALMYFTLVLGSLLPNSDVKTQSLAVLIIILETILWFSFIAVSFSNKKIRRWYFAKQKIVDLATAGIFSIFILLLLVNLFSVIK